MNKKLIKLIWVGITLIFCQTFVIQAQDENQISVKKLLKDFDDFEKIIEAHPDPYTHISEEAFKSQLENVKSTLDRPHSTLAFYKKVASIVALIKDGHSSVYLPGLWLQKQRKKRGAFPYEVHLTNEDELYVIKNFNNGEIPVGSKIITINGIGVDSFLRKIDPYISYELKPFRNTLIDGNFEKHLYIAFGHTDKTIMEYFTADTAFAEIKNMPYKDWKKFQKNNKEEAAIQIAKGKPYDYKKITDGIGLIHIYAFQAEDLETYNEFLLKTFKRIRKDSIHSLIIDIRGNFGGWPKIASRLFHYISDTYFKTMGKSSMKISDAYRKNLHDRIPYLRSNLLSGPQRRHYINVNAILGNPIGSFVNEEAFFNEKPVTEKFEYQGDCYLLTNRDSYSAASSFASTFQCYRMGTIIGEETGGTKIFRANPMYEELSKSGLRIGLSTTKLFTTCYNEEFEGIKPIIKFTPSILEITSGIDAQLLYTLRLIKKVQKMKAMEKDGE